MTLDEWLAELAARGARISVSGDRVRVYAPAGVLTDELRAAQAGHTPALLARFGFAFDPRPDLAGDHARWMLLLEKAWRLDGADPAGAYGALYGVRCCGACLAHAGSDDRSLQPGGAVPGWRLERGEMAEPEWAEIRSTWLEPHREAIKLLLAAPKTP